MPSPDVRSESICLWLISVLLFIATASGGLLLVLVLILPEDDVTRWFPEVGLLLVGTPWIFWFFMATYRWLFGGASGDAGDAGGRSPETGGKAGWEGEGSPEEKVTSDNQGKEGEGEAGTPVFAMALDVPEGDGLVGDLLPIGSSESVGKVSSIAASSMSRECEVPLTLAMSS